MTPLEPVDRETPAGRRAEEQLNTVLAGVLVRLAREDQAASETRRESA